MRNARYQDRLRSTIDGSAGLPVVGMIGGGQLARMTHQAAISLGQSLRILSDTADDSAARIARNVVVGDERSLADLISFASDCDVVTFDHELVPSEHLRAMEAKGINLQPSPDALQHAQDKHLMRKRLSELGLPCPAWAPITSADELSRFGADVGWPVVVKAARGGYDGRGVHVLDSMAAGAELLASGTALIAEEKVAIKRELASLVARSPSGQGAAWPVVETVQEDGICVEVLAPAPDLSEELAEAASALGLRIATELSVTGVLAVELFETLDGRLLVNELAMRPHNSGHWTIEGSRTSQFEQHLRAVLDYPLGATELAAPCVVMANILGAFETTGSLDDRLHQTLARWPDVKVHLYGKEHRPGRKLGHVTALGGDAIAVRARARAAARFLADGTLT